MRITGIQYHHIRLLFLQFGGNVRTPDGVSRNKKRFFIRVAKHHAARLTQTLRQLRHGIRAVGAVLTTVIFAQLNVTKAAVFRHHGQIVKALRAQQIRIAVVLHVDRFVFADPFNGCPIPVIVMCMGDDDGINIQNGFNVKR
ncbi:hypothetical protein D3C80_1141120 [compost metagenome]